MKKSKLLLLIIITVLLFSCEEHNAILNSKDGDVIIIEKDTFDVVVDSHIVMSSVKIHSRNVTEYLSPVWTNKTNLDSTFNTRSEMPIGSIQVYKFIKKRK